MTTEQRTSKQLASENEELRARLAEAERTLAAVGHSPASDLNEHRQLVADVRAHQHEIASLHRISEIALREQPLSVVLHEVVQEVSTSTGFPIVAIEFYDKARQVMEVVASVGMHIPADQAGFHIPVDQTLSGLVARSDQPLIETHAQSRSEYADESLRRLDVETFVCVPMRVTGHVIGTVALAHPDVVLIDTHLMPLVHSLANFIAALIARRRAEEHTAKSERQGREILDRLAAGVLLIDIDGRYLFANQRAADMFGLTPTDVIGKTLFDTLSPEVAQTYLERNRRLIATRSFEEYESTFTLPLGERTFFISDQVLVDERGEGYALLTSSIDITANRRAEADLQVALTKYQTLFEAFPLGIAVSNAQGQIIEANTTAEQLVGIGRNELTQRQIDGAEWRIVRPDGTPMPTDEYASVRALKEQRILKNIEMGVITPSGTTRWINVIAAPLPLEDQGLVIITYGDISERKEAEAALQRSEHAFRTLYESMRDAFVSTDMSGVIRQYNSSFKELIGYTDEEIAQLTYKDITPEQWHTLEAYILQEQILPRGYSDLYEKEYQSKSGAIIPIELRTMLTHDENGQPSGMWAMIRDITARKQAEAALHKTMEELTRSNADLEQFASVASHDLQEPLRAVTSMVQLLQQRYHGQIDARADEYIALAVEAATRMQTLINDLLTFSRVQRRGKPFAPTRADVALTTALANLQVAITESAATITHDTLPTVLADPTQLTQLFQNLISNAIKFHSEIPPLIHISADRRDGTWCFSVHDNGIGISPDYFERIFVIFQRLHPRRDYPGTGIGLALCKKIIERHNGQIWVESHLGHGTTFFFTIPDRS
jgi:PAS domain S-box-containing protein